MEQKMISLFITDNNILKNSKEANYRPKKNGQNSTTIWFQPNNTKKI